MPDQCYGSIKGLVARATRLDACGVPLTGATDSVVTDGFITIGLTAQIEQPDEITQRNAAGALCIDVVPAPFLRRYDLAIDFCQVDPALFELIADTTLVTNPDGDAVGMAVDDLPKTQKFGLEVWTEVPGDACEGGAQTWVYWLLPFVANGRLGDMTIENGAATFPVAANTQRGSRWGRGPYIVVPTAAGNATPGILPAAQAITNRQHLYQRLTTVAPPEAACGYVAA